MCTGGRFEVSVHDVCRCGEGSAWFDQDGGLALTGLLCLCIVRCIVPTALVRERGLFPRCMPSLRGSRRSRSRSPEAFPGPGMEFTGLSFRLCPVCRACNGGDDLDLDCATCRIVLLCSVLCSVLWAEVMPGCVKFDGVCKR